MTPKSVLRTVLERVETGFDAAFTPTLNPLYQLGALAWFFYWIVIATGIYLYVFFDTGVEDAYASIERITTCSGTRAASCAASTATPPTRWCWW